MLADLVIVPLYHRKALIDGSIVKQNRKIMITEITKTEFGLDKKPCFTIRNAEIVTKEEIRSGVSKNTGEEWKVQNINVKLNMGEDVRPDYMRITIPSRILDCYDPSHLKVGDLISVQVSFSITGTRFLQNDVRVLKILECK